jgi:hypothetical protein
VVDGQQGSQGDLKLGMKVVATGLVDDDQQSASSVPRVMPLKGWFSRSQQTG